jgi:two-component system OmpR family sensor kinase
VRRRLATIRGRLLAGLLGLMAVGLIGSSFVTSILLTNYLHDRDRTTLGDSAQRVREVMTHNPQDADAEQLGALLGAPLGVVITGPDGRAAASSGSGDRVPQAVARLTADAPMQVLSYHRDDEDLALLAVRIPATGLTIVGTDGDAKLEASAVILTIDTNIADDAIRGLIVNQVVIVAITLVLLALLTLLVLRVGLRPLSRMAAAADAIASGARDRRLPTAGGGVETDQLATAVNRAFDAQAEAEATVRVFAADASHELRTPLATISGWLDLYNQGALAQPEQLEQALERVNGEVGRMRLIVDDLSLLARLDAGRPLEREEVDVAALAEGIVEDARVVSPERDFRLEVAGPALVRGDEPRLAQVLRNLVGNAVQHTPPEAGVAIRVGADRAVVRVEVADDGPGIAPEHLERVFERFYRAESSRSRALGGSGLGLAIVQAIIRAHDGTVSVASDLGEGTTITVVLPRAENCGLAAGRTPEDGGHDGA